MPEPSSPPLPPSRDDEETVADVIEAETAPKAKANPVHHAHKQGPDKGFLDRAWERQEKVERKWASIGSGRFARVLRMARKPEPEEFRQSSTIVLVGIGVIGGIGFLIFLLMSWLMDVVGA